MIHNNRAMVRTTLRAVRLEAANWLLLLQEGGVFMAGAGSGV